MHPLLEPWANFNVAVAGASAALAGLIIVAMSVNLDGTLLASPIPARAGASIGALTLAVAASCLALIPDQSLVLLGVELLAGGLATLWIALLAVRRIYRARSNVALDPQRPSPLRLWWPGKVAMHLAPPVLFTVGGGVLVTGNAHGLNWIAAASIIAIVTGVAFGWIALVEVRR
ncbi:hypothetical protein GCM10010528_10740 [Gordonia defluvii]|uniref:Uncharacterized protein n=1 Tax=Gordonia defluvii TaxID=283718 RepID=A0ABP6L8J0_9ACTN|nr:hypothetical protein [Gordonia sp. UBA5067]